MANLGTTKTARKFNTVRWLKWQELYDAQARFNIINMEEATFQNFMNKRQTDNGFRIFITVVEIGKYNPTVFQNTDYKIDVRTITDSAIEYWGSLYEDVQAARSEQDIITDCYVERNAFTGKDGDEIVYFRLTDNPPVFDGRIEEGNEEEYTLDDHPF